MIMNMSWSPFKTVNLKDRGWAMIIFVTSIPCSIRYMRHPQQMPVEWINEWVGFWFRGRCHKRAMGKGASWYLLVLPQTHRQSWCPCIGGDLCSFALLKCYSCSDLPGPGFSCPWCVPHSVLMDTLLLCFPSGIVASLRLGMRSVTPAPNIIRHRVGAPNTE